MLELGLEHIFPMEIQILHLNFRSFHTPGSLSLTTLALTEIDVVDSLSKYFECKVFFITVLSFSEFLVKTEWVVVCPWIYDARVKELHHALGLHTSSCPHVLLSLQRRTLDGLRLGLFTSLPYLQRQLGRIGVLFPLRTEPQILQRVMWVHVADYNSWLINTASCNRNFSFKRLTFDARAAVLRLSLTGLLL